MPSDDGFIKSTAGSRFAATFMLQEIMFNFSGSFASSVPGFTCNTATLDYPNLKAISSTRSFEGRVRPSKVTLNLENGPTINGVLDMPSLLEASSREAVSGLKTRSLNGFRLKYNSEFNFLQMRFQSGSLALCGPLTL